MLANATFAYCILSHTPSRWPDYYRAFLKVCDETVDREGRFRLPILIPTRQLIRYAGKVESPKERQEAKRWFERMTGTLIKGGLYRAKHKDYV